MTDAQDLSDRLLDAALPHVAFDGWSEACLRAAIAETEADPTQARAIFPRGAVDLAVAYHLRGDRAMVDRLAEADLQALRIRERVTFAIRTRLEVADRELVRRGMSLFALPIYAGDGAQLLWGSSDVIWTALGDTSRDVSWYTKRATLSAVYSSVVLFWLGDDSPGSTNTWAFLDRRIDNVMKIEKVKASLRKAPVIGRVLEFGTKIKAPMRDTNIPGQNLR